MLGQFVEAREGISKLKQIEVVISETMSNDLEKVNKIEKIISD